MLSGLLGLCVVCYVWCVFFFKQKTAYDMRISDWSSDVCSSDLAASFNVQDPLAKRYSFDTWQQGGRDSAPLLDVEATLDAKGEWTQPLQVDDGPVLVGDLVLEATVQDDRGRSIATDRKSTRLNSSP